MKCENCNQKMNKVDRRTEMTGLVDTATEGQMADYLAAELSGDHGSWSVGVVEYQCPNCLKVYQNITDELKSYDPLILSWHDKAKEGDFFSRFVFEYLGFVALLHNKLFIGIGSDRCAIQALKNDRERERIYVAAVTNSEPLQRLWQDVIVELGRAALHNSSRDFDNPEIDIWWNNSDFKPNRDDQTPKGIVRSLSD